MDRIARASTDERRLVFEAAAQRMALAPAVVEKDFWVCYTLDHLFHRSGFAESMVFKGGTSLSKAFGLIERFSEDIDLILDWRLLGYGENEPWEPRSNSAQERFKADSIERTNVFLADAFAPKLRATLSESLGTEVSVRCGAEEETVYFDYPRSYESAGTLDTIKLEIGPMAAWSPSEEAAITPPRPLVRARPRRGAARPPRTGRQVQREVLPHAVGQAGRREARHAQARPSEGQARRVGGRLRLDEADAVRQLPEYR